MFPSEAEIEDRLAALRRRREALDRLIADHALYLELGRRLRGSDPGDGGGLAEPACPADAPSRDRDDAGEPEADLREPAGPAAEPGPASRTGPSPAPAPAGPPAPLPIAFEEDPVAARRYGRALIAASLAVLEEAGRPLHASEILEGIARRGFILPGQDPVAALNTRLWKRSGTGGPVRRLGEAVYALAEE
ncbi:winged helix-turn-helix domain-containing protein [Methylobacterium durans]|uniref:winged helix-turn-helix domain-containing protein n=1 Tax=Methylobacterium durans TaxID=2202825 RepID=UPI002AFFF7E4|nr:winged helix-turn-helix domain-containing protein [Methylobacterium durans]MEA1834680.1 winged helix-turn-helix domain-containing protein [Methylobacterium durans]